MNSCFGCVFLGRSAGVRAERLQAFKELEDIQGTLPKVSSGGLASKVQHLEPVAKGQDVQPLELNPSLSASSDEPEKGCLKTIGDCHEAAAPFMAPLVLAEHEVFVEVKSAIKSTSPYALKGTDQSPIKHAILEQHLQAQSVRVHAMDHLFAHQGQPTLVHQSPPGGGQAPLPPLPTAPETLASPASDCNSPGAVRSPPRQAPTTSLTDASDIDAADRTAASSAASPRPDPADSPTGSPVPTASTRLAGPSIVEDLAASLSAWETQQQQPAAAVRAGEPSPPATQEALSQPADQQHTFAASRASPAANSPAAAQERFAAFCNDALSGWAAAAAAVGDTPAPDPGAPPRVFHPCECIDEGTEPAAHRPPGRHLFPNLQPLATAIESSSTGTSVCTWTASEVCCGGSTHDASGSSSSATTTGTGGVAASTPTSAACGRPPLSTANPAAPHSSRRQPAACCGQLAPLLQSSPAADSHSAQCTANDASSAAKQRGSHLSGRLQCSSAGGAVGQALGSAGAATPLGTGRTVAPPSSGSSTKGPALTPQGSGCAGAAGGGQAQGPTPRRIAAGVAGVGAGVGGNLSSFGSGGPRASPLSVGYGGGPRGSRFMPLYGPGGASIGPAGGRKTPPPAAAYSSASTRLALHDVLSRRATRSRGGQVPGGSMGLVSLGGSGQLADVDFRPRWRY